MQLLNLIPFILLILCMLYVVNCIEVVVIVHGSLKTGVECVKDLKYVNVSCIIHYSGNTIKQIVHLINNSFNCTLRFKLVNKSYFFDLITYITGPRAKLKIFNLSKIPIPPTFHKNVSTISLEFPLDKINISCDLIERIVKVMYIPIIKIIDISITKCSDNVCTISITVKNVGNDTGSIYLCLNNTCNFFSLKPGEFNWIYSNIAWGRVIELKLYVDNVLVNRTLIKLPSKKYLDTTMFITIGIIIILIIIIIVIALVFKRRK